MKLLGYLAAVVFWFVAVSFVTGLVAETGAEAAAPPPAPSQSFSQTGTLGVAARGTGGTMLYFSYHLSDGVLRTKLLSVDETARCAYQGGFTDCPRTPAAFIERYRDDRVAVTGRAYAEELYVRTISLAAS